LIKGGKLGKDYKGKEYKICINWKRRDGDKAMPKKVVDLEKRFKETKDRSDITLMEFLSDRGFTKEDSPMKNVLKEIMKEMEEEKTKNASDMIPL